MVHQKYPFNFEMKFFPDRHSSLLYLHSQRFLEFSHSFNLMSIWSGRWIAFDLPAEPREESCKNDHLHTRDFLLISKSSMQLMAFPTQPSNFLPNPGNSYPTLILIMLKTHWLWNKIIHEIIVGVLRHLAQGGKKESIPTPTPLHFYQLLSFPKM